MKSSSLVTLSAMGFCVTSLFGEIEHMGLIGAILFSAFAICRSIEDKGT